VRKEVKEWMEKAEKDLKRAEFLLSVGDFEDCAFHAHQAAEKALKALYILKFKRLWKTHDLEMIASTLKAQKRIIETSRKLNPHYIETRYPTKTEYNEEIATNAIDNAKKVIKWVKEKLKKLKKK
jgi:HEPN domain-containing protein